MRIVVALALALVAACAEPQQHRAPAPTPPIPTYVPPRPDPETPRDMAATTPVTSTCAGTSNISLATRNETTIRRDLCVVAGKALAKVPVSGSGHVDIVVSRVSVGRHRLTCEVELDVQPAGGGVVTNNGKAMVQFNEGREADRRLAAEDCIDAIVEDLIESHVAQAIAPVPQPSAPWVPPALRVWQPIPSPTALPPKPTTLGTAP